VRAGRAVGCMWFFIWAKFGAGGSGDNNGVKLTPAGGTAGLLKQPWRHLFVNVSFIWAGDVMNMTVTASLLFCNLYRYGVT